MNKEDIKLKMLELKNNSNFMSLYKKYNGNFLSNNEYHPVEYNSYTSSIRFSQLELKKMNDMIKEKGLTVEEFNKNLIELL